jgi:hypothetical protein
MGAVRGFSRRVPVHYRAEVVVAGGGPAGVAAAVAARRAGRRVVLLERSAQLGGMATSGGVAIWMPVGNLTGLYKEFVRELGLKDNRGREWESTRKFAPLFNPFLVRQYFNWKLEREGVTVFFHADCAGAIPKRGRLTAVVAGTREGLRAFDGRVFVDATGDARLAREAGVRCHSGRDRDGLTQPMTLMFQMQKTDRPATPRLPEGCPRYEKVEDLPQGRLLFWEDAQTKTLLVNMTRVRGHGAKLDEISAAEREGLRQVFGVCDFLQRTSYPDYVLSHVAAQIGVRETHQIQGLYTLTEEDLLAGRRFPDVVAQSDYSIDVHNPDGKSGTEIRQLKTYDIPYRCLVPKRGPGNLIVAGRALSATHHAMSSARVMPTCFALGQAAGLAASMAVEKKLDFQDVPAAELSARLKAQGVEFQTGAK